MTMHGAGVIPPLKSQPIRTVLKWQAFASVAIAAVAGVWAGWHGALSAALGGIVTLSSTVVYAVVLGMGAKTSAGASVVYRDVVLAALFAGFVITVLLFRMALLTRD
jgi:ATP synthase protein I